MNTVNHWGSYLRKHRAKRFPPVPATSLPSCCSCHVAAAVPFLEKSASASIVLISSVSGFEVDFAAGSYGAIKAALIHYAKGLSRQLVSKGIRVNAVSPGNTYFDGGIWQNIEKNVPDLFSSTIKVNPTGKFGTPQEVANGVVFISSPVASRISGTNLVIDGALTVAV